MIAIGRNITTVNTIADRLKAAREAAGLTQGQLAAKARVAQGTIGNIEGGTRQNPRELLAIAEACGVSASWLKTGRGPRQIDGDPTPTTPDSLSLHDAMERVGVALAQAMPADDRAELADVMAMWARYEGKDKYRKAAEELLTEPQAGDQAEPGKRNGTR